MSLDEMRSELRQKFDRLRRNPLGEHKVRDPDAVKRYTLWIERLEKAGLRDPEDPSKTIPPSDPRTRREIERLKVDLAYAKGEIDLDEYYKRYERLKTGSPSPGSDGISESECFEGIWRKYKGDERVFEMLRKAGPVFPLPGPHYDYADLIEHTKHSLLNLCTCNPDELPEYHLLEIYGRRRRLSEKVPELARAGLISESDYEHYLRHIGEIVREWENDFKTYFSKCKLGGVS